QIDTNGSAHEDTVLSFKDSSCGIELECDDDGGTDGRSLMVLDDVTAGTYTIQVDPYSDGEDAAITVNVRGVVAIQTPCTSPLFTTGVLGCPMGTSCSAGRCQ
ncbi:MAG: hypothetical protein H0T42_10820, partial [Deltaproteobacteria bacterium]|nr:hypothetical protein [Deltaproteobacteria bacterium]